MRQKIRRTTISCKRNVQNLVQRCACELKGNSAKRVFKRYFDEVGKKTKNLFFNTIISVSKDAATEYTSWLACSRNSIYTTKYKHAFEIMSQK